MSSSIQVAADTVIFQRGPMGGIARAFQEIFPRMCDQDRNLKIYLWGSEPHDKPLPTHPQIVHRHLVSRNFRPARLRPYLNPFVDNLLLRAGISKSMIWHSVYFVLPPQRTRAVLVNVYDMIYQRFPEMFNSNADNAFRLQQKRVIQHADIVICNSLVTAKDTSEVFQIPMDRMRVIGRAPSNSFRVITTQDSQSELPTKRPFLIYVGTRAKHKNFKGLLDAYARWQQSHEIDLVVVSSSAWTQEEQDQLNHYGIAPQVHLLQRITDDKLSELYNHALAFVYPSLWEGFGIPLIEAMACGCPIVASNIPSSHEVCDSLPYYFELNRPDSLHMALSQAVSDGRNSARVQAGLAHVKRYNWDDTARQLLDIYRSVG